MTWQTVSRDELLARSAGDPFVVCEAPPRLPGLVSEWGWAVLTVDDNHRASAFVVFDRLPDGFIGEPEGADELIAALDALMEERGWRLCWFITHDGIEVPLAAPWQRGATWVWMSTTQPAPDDTGWQLIELDDHADADELRAFALPINPIWEGDPGLGRNRFWLGARDDAGALIACGTAHESSAGIGHLAGLVVDPAYRGQGLGRALVLGLSQRVLASDGITTLSAYGDNDSAIRVYLRSGYQLNHRFRSRFTEPRR